MLVKELSDDQIRVGMRIWNKGKTQQGTITMLDWECPDAPEIIVIWDGGEQSKGWAHQMELEVIDDGRR